VKARRSKSGDWISSDGRRDEGKEDSLIATISRGRLIREDGPDSSVEFRDEEGSKDREEGESSGFGLEDVVCETGLRTANGRERRK